MATFVMVHGSWHGGWCWKRVVPFLTMRGHDVHTPTLSGCAEHAHTATAALNLDAHIEDIRAFLFMNDLDDVILVGHSSAGMVITGVVDRIAERVSRLVYFDAFVPRDGDSLAALTGRSARPPDAVAANSGPAVSGIERLPPITAAELGATMEIDSGWLTPRLTPAPAGPAYQPLRLRTDAFARKAKSYIFCREGSGRFQRFASEARAAGWDYHELDAGHDAMITKPRATADAMLAIAALGH